MKVFYKIILFLLFVVVNLNAQWTKTNLPTTAFSLAISGDNIFAGTLSGGVFRSTNNGTNWTEINNGITIKQVWAIAALGNSIFAGTTNGGLFKSIDNGNTWIISNTGLPTTTIVRALAQFGTKLFATTTNSGVYVSLDNGSTWAQHNNGIVGLVARPLLTTETDLFVGVMQKVYKYDNTNSKWLTASAGIPNNTVTAIAQVKSNKDLFAAISNSGSGVSKSSDNGTSWVVSDNGLPRVPVDALAAVGTNLFAANDYGVYLSTNNGTSWSDVSAGMTIASYCTFLIPGKTDLFVIYQGGVWKRPYAGMITSVKQTSKEIPGEFELSQNYPNPFNPETTISYSITTPSNVSLKVYDVLGNEVATLVNQYQQAGSYNSKFSIGNYQLTSGIYFYTLKTAGFVQTKKMLLIK